MLREVESLINAQLSAFWNSAMGFFKHLPWIKDLVVIFVIIISVNDIINEVYDMGIDLHLFFSNIMNMRP